MEAICPACQRALYSRSRATCGYCGAPIPVELRFSIEETAAIKAEIAEIERRHQIEKAKEERQEEKRRRDAAD